MRRQLLLVVVSAVLITIGLCLAAKQDTTTGLFVSTVCGDSNGLAQRTFITAPFFVKTLDQDTMCMLDGTMVALIQLSTGSLTRMPTNPVLTSRSLHRDVHRTPDGSLEFYYNAGNQVKKLDVNGTIVTVGGKLESGFEGDGGLATDALMDTVTGVHVSQEGHVFVSDSNNNRIRKIFKNGTIVTVAGNGVCDGISRVVDGELATSVSICPGSIIRTTPSGEIYFSDVSKIFKVSTEGIITKVAGSGQAGFGGDGGLAINASFDLLFDFDLSPSGQIFLIDSHRVRKIDTNGIITTIAGGSEPRVSWEEGPAVNASLANPNSLSVVKDDVVLIANTANRQVKMISHSKMSIVAGRPHAGSGYGGPARDALLYKPQHITTSPQGDIFFVENNSVHKISATSGLLTTIAGTGTAEYAPDGVAVETPLYVPLGVSVSSSGRVYITEPDRIRVVDQNGLISTVAGIKETYGFTGDGGLATNATFERAVDVFAAASGVIYILDGVRIRKISQDGTISTIAGNGNMGYSGDGGPALKASFVTPQSLFVTANEEIYIADSGNHRIRKIDNKGIITTVAGGGRGVDDELAIKCRVTYPTQVVVSPSGHIYIAETGGNRIRVVLSNSGIITTIAGMKKKGIGGNGILAKNSTLDNPLGVAVSHITGEVYVSDTNNNVIRKLSCRNYCGELCTMPCATRVRNQIQTPELPIGQPFTTLAYFGIVLAVVGAFAIVGCVLYNRTRKNLSNV